MLIRDQLVDESGRAALSEMNVFWQVRAASESVRTTYHKKSLHMRRFEDGLRSADAQMGPDNENR